MGGSQDALPTSFNLKVLLQDFVYLLSAFSGRASADDKVHIIFSVYDSDGDGIVSADDMELMLRQLAGSSLRYSAGLTLFQSLHSSCLHQNTRRLAAMTCTSSGPGCLLPTAAIHHHHHH